MSQQAVLDILTRSLLDVEFRAGLSRGDPEAIKDYDLNEAERSQLTRGNSSLQNGFDEQDFFPRVTLIRAVVAPERDLSANIPWSDLPSNNPKLVEFASEVRNAANLSDRSIKLATLISEMEPKTKLEAEKIDSVPAFQAQGIDIYVVGLGISGFDQVTPESMEVMKKSSHVFYVSSSLGSKEFFLQNGIVASDLMDCYAESHHRSIAYQKMAEKVVAAALEGGPVTLAEYGHPTVFAYPPFIISKLAKLLNLKMKVLPAVSAMDCIFAELMIDPAHSGLQMFEATDLILRDRPLYSDVAALIWQIGSVETALYSTGESQPTRFVRLTQHLTKFYPPGHEVTAIYCSNHPLISSKIYKFQLWTMPDQAELLHPGYTLYIPPATVRNTRDFQLEHDVRSVSHLAKISK